jgi:hypothetical protein
VGRSIKACTSGYSRDVGIELCSCGVSVVGECMKFLFVCVGLFVFLFFVVVVLLLFFFVWCFLGGFFGGEGSMH